MKKPISICLWAIACLLFISCSKNDDPEGGLDVDLSLFQPIPELFPYNDLTPATPVNYWEFMLGSAPEFHEVLYANGTKCEDATDPAACTTTFDETFSENQGFATGCLPGGCFYYIRFQQADTIGLVTSTEELRQYLGDIDTPDDAILLALANGYWFRTNNIEGGAFRAVGNGYQLIMTRTVKFCAPIQEDRYLLEVSRNGTVRVLQEEVWIVDENACI